MARSAALPTEKIEKNPRRRTASPSLSSEHERERALKALQKAGLLAEPTPEMRRVAEEYDASRSPVEQERLLAELRRLRLKPALSEIILQNRK